MGGLRTQTSGGGGGGGVPTSRNINTTAPLAGGGDLTADRTLTTSMNTNRLIGRGTAAVGVMEEITLGTNLSLTGTTLNAASAGTTITTQDEGGTLSTTTNTLNFVGAGVTATGGAGTCTVTIPGGVAASRAINTTAPITGGGDLSADRTIAMPQAASGVSGFLSGTDWNIFNAKGNGTVTSVGATAPLTSSGGATPNISTSMNTNRLLGRGTAAVGVMEEIILGTNLSLTGTTLNATGGAGSVPDFLLQQFGIL